MKYQFTPECRDGEYCSEIEIDTEKQAVRIEGNNGAIAVVTMEQFDDLVGLYLRYRPEKDD